MAKNPNAPFPPQKGSGSAKLPQPVKGPLGSISPPPNPEEFYQPPSAGPLGSVPGGPSPRDVQEARQKASALLAQAAKLSSEDNDELESEARAAGVPPSEVQDALLWLGQVAKRDPKWLLSAVKRLDPSAVPQYSVSNLFAVYRQRNSLR